MSSPIIQATRKAVALDGAIEAVKEMKTDTPILDETLAEPFIADENKIVAVLAELAEMVGRQEATVNHTADQVIASQDTEIKRLRERVEKLEKPVGEGQGKTRQPKSQPKSSRKK